MTASHEVVKPVNMPFILDAVRTSTEFQSQDGAGGDHNNPQLLTPITPTLPPKPHRTQSATAITHPSIRVPSIIPEVDTSCAPESHATVSPRRARAGSVVARPLRTSAEQRPTEEDVSWWTEEMHKRREIRRRWREAEDENMVIIGNRVDTNHPNYVTAYNMLTGLRVAVSRVSAKVDRELTDEDFKFCQKFTFDNQGNELSPASKHDFKFKDYAPWVFRHLRALFHLDPADYLISLTSHILLSELGSPGKSGSFFYFSRDYRFVIKTLHPAEHRYLRKILRQYFEHVKSNPNTLISQFYGLHRVKMKGRKVHLVVINNVFPAHRDIHQTFDLKGSTVGREFDESKLKDNPKGPLKDLNWMRHEAALHLGPRKKNLLMSQLKRDVELLSSLNIMDYSLLIGIHDLARGNSENIRGNTLSVYQPKVPLHRIPSKKGKEIQFDAPPLKRLPTNLPNEGFEGFLERKRGYFTSEDGGLFATNVQDDPTGDYIYYFGVIDLLTTVPPPPNSWTNFLYGIKKHLETLVKGFSHPREQLSAVPPDQYAERFVKFIRGSIRPKDEIGPQRQAVARQDLIQTAIPEESPVATPPAETPLGELTGGGGGEVGRAAEEDHQLPVVTVEHLSLEMKEVEPEKEMRAANGKALVNGWSGDYFGEKITGLAVETGVH